MSGTKHESQEVNQQVEAIVSQVRTQLATYRRGARFKGGDREACALDHVLEASMEVYESILAVAQAKGMTGVVDIGCAFGHQSALFELAGMSYVGINDDELPFYNNGKHEYLIGTYPKVDLSPHPLDGRRAGISTLCLGWSCFLTQGEETLLAQLDGLSRDFNEVILSVPHAVIPYLKQRYNTVEVFDVCYFSTLVYATKKTDTYT